jgi:hypothetical protein
MVYAPAKLGKTTMVATLDKMTKRYFGKPSLLIPLEAADGGGAMSLNGLDVDYVIPKDYKEMRELLAELQGDTKYGGVILDSSSEYVKVFLQPHVLATYPSREHTATRSAGVMERSDYQTCGEMLRQDFNRLIRLSASTTPENRRKHVVVTALQRSQTDENGSLIAIQPDLPGAMAGAATAMFNVVGQVKIVTEVGKDTNGRPSRTTRRVFTTSGDGVIVRGDRTNRIPPDCPPDFEWIWEKAFAPLWEKEPANT